MYAWIGYICSDNLNLTPQRLPPTYLKSKTAPLPYVLYFPVQPSFSLPSHTSPETFPRLPVAPSLSYLPLPADTSVPCHACAPLSFVYFRIIAYISFLRAQGPGVTSSSIRPTSEPYTQLPQYLSLQSCRGRHVIAATCIRS